MLSCMYMYKNSIFKSHKLNKQQAPIKITWTTILNQHVRVYVLLLLDHAINVRGYWGSQQIYEMEEECVESSDISAVSILFI